MEFFKIGRDIPFMRYALIFNAISVATFVLALFFLITRGLHLSVEFTGGTVMEVSYSQPADLTQVRGTVASLGYSDVQVQNFGTARDVLIRLPVQQGKTTAEQSQQVLQALKTATPDVELRRTEFVEGSSDLLDRVAHARLGSRHVRCDHDVLRERLAALELRGGRRGAERGNADGTQGIGDTRNEG